MAIFKDLNVERLEAKLDNGVKVVHFYRKGSPVAISAILKSGSRYDKETMPGGAHFLEHMIVSGSERFPTKDLLVEHIESVGGSFGAWTGPDTMGVDIEISDKADFVRVVDAFQATLCNPILDKKVFENEKLVVIKEIKKSDSNPARLLIKTCRNLFMIGTPFQHEVLGNEESISSLVYEDVVLEHKRLFDLSRITFVSSGDITIGELTESLNKLDLLDGEPFDTQISDFKSTEDKNIKATFFDAPQTHMAFGVIGPKFFTNDHLYLKILGLILAGGRTSRLTKRLRYNKGLIYSVGFNWYGGVDFSSWVITTDTSEEKVEEVLDEMIQEIKDIRKNGIKQVELDFVKNKMIKSMKRTMQTSKDWVNFHKGGEVFSGREYLNVDKYALEVSKTTIEDIQNVVKKYLNDEDWKVALVGRNKEDSVRIDWGTSPIL